MVDTARTLAALQALFADNVAGDISPQDLRDFLVSVFPDTWLAWTPTLGGVTGTLTTASASGRYRLNGKSLTFSVSITVTTKGSAAYVKFLLPASLVPVANQGHITGREAVLNGGFVHGVDAGGGYIYLIGPAFADPTVNGTTFQVGGTIEVT